LQIPNIINKFLVFVIKSFLIISSLIGFPFVLSNLNLSLTTSIFQADQIIQSLKILPHTETSTKIQRARVAIVFGAGLRPDEPSLVLKNRLNKASELYFNKKVDKILVSGDNRFVEHNEPQVMTDYLISLNIPEQDIVQDYAGRRTLDSCWRAKNSFEIDSAYLVTQQFHLPRAQLICSSVGIYSIPTVAENSTPEVTYYGILREILSTYLAFWDIFTNTTPPVKGYHPIIFDEN
jgi:vancomycin permeability regulator SanA